MPSTKHAFGWNCRTCSFHHHGPATRCAMCGELRGATRQEMHDFVLGKRIAPIVQGNCVELLESPESKPAANPNSSSSSNNNNNASASLPVNSNTIDNLKNSTRHNHEPPPSLPKPTTAKQSTNPFFQPGGNKNNNIRGGGNDSNRVASVRNPYFKGPHQPQLKPPPREQNTLQRQNSNHSSTMQHHQTSHQTQRPPTSTSGNTNQTGDGKENFTKKQPPTKQHSFFDKSGNKPKARRKSHPAVCRFTFKPGPVPHDPQKALTYIYPKHPDYPTREYQLEITETALNYNTLVSLPTGLGKTHIAAVVMYNYFRWFSTGRNSAANGKIIFLAPTLPLVNQQIEACYKITGIPPHETAVMTGKIKASERKELWKSRRVFYCTPQTVQKDILAACGSGEQDRPADEETDLETAQAFSKVVCLVLDEAHKATGDYAYTRVVDLLDRAAGAKFRIVGLSATPGTSIKNIQGVIEALKSCKIEARTDDDPTVAPYLHTKRTEIVVCPRNTAQKQIINKLSGILHPLLERLREEGGLKTYGNDTITAYSILKARQLYEQHARAQGRLNGGLISCFHATHQLVTIRNDCQQGLGVVKTKLCRLKQGPRGILSTIVKSAEFSEVMQMVVDATNGEGSCEDVIDPKLAKLCELLKHHFERNNACNHSSRAIVFAQFRDSVSVIVNCLESNLKPLVRSRYFVGQNKGASGGSKGTDGKPDEKVQGMKQAEQQKAIKDFRNNVFNVLVCTSIGEEGLDIGDVDLIINYDVISSPIRTIQRAGRTGRKRDGRVVSLISEGPEERAHKKRLDGERTLRRALKDPKKFIMASHHPMLPRPPEKEYKTFEINSKMSLSQVAGAQHTPGAKAEKKKKTWRLDASEEYERENLCGSLVALKEQVTWERLRGFFYKNRVDPTKLQGIRKIMTRHILSLEKEERTRLLQNRNKIRRKRRGKLKTGRIEGILESIQHHGPLHFKGTTRSGYRDILEIFPVDPVEEKEQDNSNRVSKQLWGNSASSSDNKYLHFTMTSNIWKQASESPKFNAEREENSKQHVSDAVAPPRDTEDTGGKEKVLMPVDDYSMGGNLAIQREEVEEQFVANAPSSDGNKRSVPEATAFRLATPPPSSDDDSSVQVDNTEDVGFRLPTPQSSSDSSSDEEDVVDEIDQNHDSVPPKEVFMDTKSQLNDVRNEMNQSSIENLQQSVDPPLQKSVEATSNNPIFQLPTPPSSSSSSSDEEENGDSDTVTVPEPNSMQEIHHDNHGIHDQDAYNAVVDESEGPNNSSIREKLDSNLEHQENNSISTFQTPRKKLSIGFDGDNDFPLSSLKPKSSSNTPKMNLDENTNDNDDNEEDVPLASFRHKITKHPILSKEKQEKTILLDNELHKKQLPSQVSFGRSQWKEKSVDDESEEDTPLIALSSKKKARSQKLTYDVPLIDLCAEKKKPNVGSVEEKGLQTDLSRKSDKTQQGKTLNVTMREKEHPVSALRTDAQILETPQGKIGRASAQSQSQSDIIGLSNRDKNRKIRPQILETPESSSDHLHVDFRLTSTQEPSQNEIIDHSKKSKSRNRVRIGSEGSEKESQSPKNSMDLELNVSRLPQSSTPSVHSHGLPSSALKGTPISSIRADFSGTRKRSSSDLLTDTPIGSAFNDITEEIVCQFCASGDSTETNPIVLCDGCNLGFHKDCYAINIDIESEEPWYCKSCTNKKTNDGEKLSPRPKKLRKKNARVPTKSSTSASSKLEATGAVDTIVLDETDNDISPRTKKLELRERRRQGLAKFVLDEAEMGSDQEQDDADEEEELRRLEEEEAYSQDSFINDNAVLTQHFSQDILGEIDPDAASIGGNPTGTPGMNQRSHRALDAQRERDNMFKTPNFNRRMMRPESSSQPSSAQGLGNMNFIRSVLEHHRRGGNCNQIEAEYKRIETSSSSIVERNTPVENTPISTTSNHEDGCIDLTTPPEIINDARRQINHQSIENGNGNGNTHQSGIDRQSQPQSGGLTAEQLARIEANRQAALRRRAELLAKKQHPSK